MTDCPQPIAELLTTATLPVPEVWPLILRALAEDLPSGVDVTTEATVPAEQLATLDLVARAPGVIAGVPVALAVFLAIGQVDVKMALPDGSTVARGDIVLSVSGRTHDLLRAERPALNLLGHLSGIATVTRSWVEAVAGSKAEVRDTRKTTPGLRALEKYAVRCGGGRNHRMSLSDAALVKDNHVAAAGGVARAFELVRERYPALELEVEVDTLEQLDEVLTAGADLVLLDNFTIPQLEEAVHRTAGAARLEASGGLSLGNAAEVAATGVDYLAVGALTHSAPVLDIGADLRQEG